MQSNYRQEDEFITIALKTFTFRNTNITITPTEAANVSKHLHRDNITIACNAVFAAFTFYLGW